MELTLSQLFPGIESGLNNIGFLFGAGTSKEAGYPLMPDLTKSVIGSLDTGNLEALEEILASKGLHYDPAKGDPNIEILSDYVIEHHSRTRDPRFGELENKIRELIVENILSVTAPDLTHHVLFLEALKRRAHGTPTTVTILTTNYDVLFELAAGEVGIRIETGFDGALRRVFDPGVFDLSRGVVTGGRFSERAELTINVLKLHGSISWAKESAGVIESGLDLRGTLHDKIMVLPRRQKVMDTLAEPFDQLFTRAARTLGTKCKYLVSCGFSYGDKHINDQLLFPKLAAKQIRLVALCGQEPECIDEFKAYPAFHVGFPHNCYFDQKDTGTGTDLWKFSSLAQLMMP